MQQPTLVVLAAGMGSRFGGLKQITPVDDHGHAIIDFSLFDAHRYGFKKVVFIIKHEIEDDFKEFIGHRMEKYFDVKYVYQQLDMLPEGYSVPEGRVKPWGTAHAIACCKDVIDGPFAVINSDDFYGPSAFEDIFKYLAEDRPDNDHAMLGYLLKNTVTENGSVARGVCQVENGYLTGITERTKIFKKGDDAEYTEDGEHFYPLSGDTPVSMNFFGFEKGIMDDIVGGFPAWLDENLKTNPTKCEYFLPIVCDKVIREKTGSLRVLECREAWYGMTYKEDMPGVTAAIQALRDKGVYPEALLD